MIERKIIGSFTETFEYTANGKELRPIHKFPNEAINPF